MSCLPLKNCTYQSMLIGPINTVQSQRSCVWSNGDQVGSTHEWRLKVTLELFTKMVVFYDKNHPMVDDNLS